MDRGAAFIDAFFKPELITRYLPDILSGMAKTIQLAILVVITGLTLGLVLALIRSFRVRAFSWPIIVFADVMRAIPPLVMVLLGGLNALAGPLIGAAAFTWLSDTLARVTEYWHAVLGVAILVIVIAFPMGIGGAVKRAVARTFR